MRYQKDRHIIDSGRVVGYVERHYERSGLLDRCRYRAWLTGNGGVNEFLFGQPNIKQVRYHLNARGYKERKCEGLERHTTYR